MSTSAPVSSPAPERRVVLNTLAIDQRRGSSGMWCVLITEFMLFVCMFGAYCYLGSNKNRWASEMPPKLMYALILLAILLSSSGVLYWGEQRVKRGAFAAGRIALWITVLMGLVFLGLQAYEYLDHWKSLAPYSDSYGSIFYALTTLHAAHVIVGLLLLCFIGVLPRFGDTRGTPHRAYETIAMYWHFVDFVWIWIVLLLYVIPYFQVRAYGH